MPCGPLTGATAALIDAVARRGVAVSRYQIERWRARGELSRVARRGLGRGRGTESREPDEETIQRTVMLAGSSRQGASRVGAHVVERLAAGLPVPEDEVRRAFNSVLDRVARMTAAEVTDDDLGWQARQEAAERAAREMWPVGWQSLLDALDGAPEQPQPSRTQARAAAAGVLHALGGGQEALGEDLVEFVGLGAGLKPSQLAELRDQQRAMELKGQEVWADIAEIMSIRNLRRTAAGASIDELRRATSVILTVTAVQAVVVMFASAQMAAPHIELPDRLRRFDGRMLRELRQDPMWTMASMYTPSSKPRQRITQLVISALGLLTVPHLLPHWENYRDRLVTLTEYNQVGNL